jgi:hypothetical protein
MKADNPLIPMVPEGGVEPPRCFTPRDFKLSEALSAATS